MTIIAYKDGTMACDSAWTNSEGTVCYKQTKIRRLLSGALYGSAGDSDDRALLRLLDKVTREKELPSRAALAEIPNDVEALLVLSNGQLFSINTGKDSASVERVHNPRFAAIGAGGTLAFGVMLAGGDARTAAKHAANYAEGCRPPVYTLKLKKAARK